MGGGQWKGFHRTNLCNLGSTRGLPIISLQSILPWIMGQRFWVKAASYFSGGQSKISNLVCVLYKSISRMEEGSAKLVNAHFMCLPTGTITLLMILFPPNLDILYQKTRSLRARWAPTSSWKHFGSFDFVLRALFLTNLVDHVLINTLCSDRLNLTVPILMTHFSFSSLS